MSQGQAFFVPDNLLEPNDLPSSPPSIPRHSFPTQSGWRTGLAHPHGYITTPESSETTRIPPPPHYPTEPATSSALVNPQDELGPFVIGWGMPATAHPNSYQQPSQTFGYGPGGPRSFQETVPTIQEAAATPPLRCEKLRQALPSPNTSIPTLADRNTLSPNSAMDYSRSQRKRRQKGTHRQSDAEPEFSSPSSASSPTPAVPPKLHAYTIAACAIWITKNLGSEPSNGTISCLSHAFDEPVVALRQWFTQYQNSFRHEETRILSDSIQETPDDATAAACDLWRLKRQQARPSKETICLLSLVFHTAEKVLSNWFTRNEMTFQAYEDSGYISMTYTDEEVSSKYGGNRNVCGSRKRKLNVELDRDEKKPYACTSRCGATFKKKDAWKRHEEINWPAKVWVCGLQGCQHKMEGNRAYYRKDHFKGHVSKEHADMELSEKEIAASSSPIKSNFNPTCIFRNCPITFRDWNERINHIADHFQNPWNMSQWREPDSEDDADEQSAGVSDGSSSSDSSDEDSGSDYDGSAETGGADSPDPSARDGPQSGGYDPGYGNSSSQPPHYGDASGGGTYGSSVGFFYAGSPPHSQFDLATWSREHQEEWVEKCICTLSIGALLKLLAPWSPQIDSLGHLGYGRMTVIDEVRIRGYQWTMARKTIQMSSSKCQKASREVANMIKLSHPHVVRVITTYSDASSLSILMQPVADYNLSQFLHTCSSTSSAEHDASLWTWCSCLAVGLQYMHEEIGIRHRDIKPSNILVRDKVVFYADFGSSNAIADDESIADTGDFTELYAAPEVRQGERGRASDIFSLGCVFLEVATVLIQRSLGELRDLQHTYINRSTQSLHWATAWVSHLRRSVSLSPASDKIKLILDVCDSMMHSRPSERPSASDIVTQITEEPCCKYDHRRPNVSHKSQTWPPYSPPTPVKSERPKPRENMNGLQSNKASNPSGSRTCNTTSEPPRASPTKIKPYKKPIPPSTQPQHHASLYKYQPRLQGFLHYTDKYQEFLGSGRSTIGRKAATRNLSKGISLGAAPGFLDLLGGLDGL
ncbi:uncharacterized protein KY384_004040 [Bacidia gigantensis]|uniref:uncharacterized protein n=1 Tax=Bacidia gigantensis TaxID=2732470 RepID=UPI001D04D96E|nr:uncharacterized protein KY384_004040 [Bacidia gigantensis]KAG8530685.1 hypothetical protein KY384_004040 [Bacidia gigantensis]